MSFEKRGPLESRFAGRLEGYIEYLRNELNHKASAEEDFFAPSFDALCSSKYPDKQALDEELATAWAFAGRGKSGVQRRLSMLRGFARYLVLEGEDAFVIPMGLGPVWHDNKEPHIYTQEELDAFFGVVDNLEYNPNGGLRHLMAPVYFRLLYCAGLRTYEARELPTDCFDLERGIIHVIGSKGKDRDVPLKADVTEMCREYSAKVEAIFPGRMAFFPDRDGSGFWKKSSLRYVFDSAWEKAGITEFLGPKPRPYDFRHTFATECIRRWRAQGLDIEAYIKILQDYMGHDDIESTFRYVHLVRGGFGDPTEYPTWEPENRMREEGLYVEL